MLGLYPPSVHFQEKPSLFRTVFRKFVVGFVCMKENAENGGKAANI